MGEDEKSRLKLMKPGEAGFTQKETHATFILERG